MHYHIIGIAGAGMSAIANILLDQGHRVSGSDLSANQLTAALAARGATTHVGHDPAYIAGADALVATSAVKGEHPELVAARARGIPILKRADLWRDWSQQRAVIAIAGTHGKTTTTAMIALILTHAGLNPGFLIGSASSDLGTNARWGAPAAPLVIEADEYDRAFLALTPSIAVITNMEWDHPDIYPTEAEYYAAFEQFAAQTSAVILRCGDSGTGTQRLTRADTHAQLLAYGLEEANDYRAVFVGDAQPTTTDGRVWSVISDRWSAVGGQFALSVPGLHNVCNALAAIGVAGRLGLDMRVVAEALRSFRGTARRFELKGEAGGVTVIDDYAHHPTEVRATLAAARARYNPRRIVAYVQPHTYSRTRALFDDWPEAFTNADVVLVGDIYGAREVGPEDDPRGNLAQQLTAGIRAAQARGPMPPPVFYVGSVAEATTAALALLQPGDVFLTLGAGDGYRVGEEVLERRKMLRLSNSQGIASREPGTAPENP